MHETKPHPSGLDGDSPWAEKVQHERRSQKASFALRLLEQLDNHRFSSLTGHPVEHGGTEGIRGKAIAAIDEFLS